MITLLYKAKKLSKTDAPELGMRKDFGAKNESL